MALYLAEELDITDKLQRLANKYNITLAEGSIKIKESKYVEHKEYSEEFCLSYIKSGQDKGLIDLVIEFFYDEKLLRGSQPMKLKNRTTGFELELDSLSSSMIFFVTALINAKKGAYTLMNEHNPSYRFLELMDRLPLKFLICYEKTDREIEDENDWKDVKLAVDYPLYDVEKHKLEVANYIEYQMGVSESEEQLSEELDLSQLEDPEDFTNNIKVINHNADLRPQPNQESSNACNRNKRQW